MQIAAGAPWIIFLPSDSSPAGKEMALGIHYIPARAEATGALLLPKVVHPPL